jgi:polyphosphate kinase
MEIARSAESRGSARGGALGVPLLNRELSWLDFNARVLELAADEKTPLLERVFFTSIFSSNLDQFFMVRVAGLMGQAAAGVSSRLPDGMTAAETLAAIRLRVLELTEAQSRLWHGELVPELAREGIHIGGVADCNDEELAEMERVYEQSMFPVLTPLGVGPGRRFPYISGLSLSLGLLAHDPRTNDERFARVKLPEILPRFSLVGHRGLMIPTEEIVAHFLDRLFPGVEIVEHAAFRVTRDADFEVSDEADDLFEAVQHELRRRRFGDAVRLEIAASASQALCGRLCVGLGIEAAQVYPIDGLLDLGGLTEIAELPRPELKFEPWKPVTRRAFRVDATASLYDRIHYRDLLVHHPYDSFATSVERFIASAAEEPEVIAVKTTVYRTSDESLIAPALIEAAEQGKQSVCLVELKARFDEGRNIEWSRRLEQAGVHVVHGFPNMKIHAKTTLVVRREGDLLRRYAHIGTGNYHATTARSYEDFGFFTDDEDITADVADLFNFLTGLGRPKRFRKLVVAPFALRTRLVEETKRVADAARAGMKARIRIKVNALSDPEIIEALYAASAAGARIEIVCRGICTLVPGLPGVSESIRVISILGRFLEHSRVFSFEVDGDARVFIGSADLMPRNLDHRVEVLVPLEDQRLRDEVRSVFDLLLEDNTQAWELEPTGRWKRIRRGGRGRRGTHARLISRARARARRSAGP